MRIEIALLALGALALASCSANVDTSGVPTGPLVEGEVVTLTIWNHPVAQRGGGTPQHWSYDEDSGARVEVYETFIVVTEKDGDRRVAPHGWYDHLLLK